MENNNPIQNTPQGRGVSGGRCGTVGKHVITTVMIVLALALAALELFPPVYSADKVLNGIISVIVTRAVGLAVFLPLTLRFGYRVFGLVRKGRARALLVTLPALLVVVNNLPIIGLSTGAAAVSAPGWYIALFALESALIGLFEEFAFRGVLYLSILEHKRNTAGKIFAVTIASSALFGGVHLFNLFAGAGIGGVLLQIGYSFLIGGMCSIVLLKTGNIWICALLHGIYDFCGYLVPTLGHGVIWDGVTVTVTAVLGVAVLVHMVFVLVHIKPEDIAFLYPAAPDEALT